MEMGVRSDMCCNSMEVRIQLRVVAGRLSIDMVRLKTCEDSCID